MKEKKKPTRRVGHPDLETMVRGSLEPTLFELGFVRQAHREDIDLGESLIYQFEYLELCASLRRGEIVIRIRNSNSADWYVLRDLLDLLEVESIGTITLQGGELKGAPPVDEKELGRQADFIRRHFGPLADALHEKNAERLPKIIGRHNRELHQRYLLQLRRKGKR